MKLQNRETLKVVDAEIRDAINDDPKGLKVVDNETGEVIATYTTLADLFAHWQDYEEPKEIVDVRQSTADRAAVYIEMANEKEAEKAVEKIKALQRLKDKGFKFTYLSEGKVEFKLDKEYSEFTYNGYDDGCEFYVDSDVNNDLETLFGVEI